MGNLLLIGSSGFIGRHFFHFLCKKGFDSSKVYHINKDKLDDSENSFTIDLNDVDKLESAIRHVSPDFIVNFAGQISGPRLSQFVNSNFLCTLNLLECVKSSGCNVKRIVLIGSAAEYGINKDLPLKEGACPLYINDYGFSKHLQKLLASYVYKQDKLPVVIARPFNIIGSGMSTNLAIGAFIERIKSTPNKGTIKVGNLQGYRDYLDIEDVSAAIELIMINGKNGSEYNICSGERYQMNEILEQLISISGKEINVESKIPDIQETDESFGDNNRLKEELGWRNVISLNESLYKAYHNEKDVIDG